MLVSQKLAIAAHLHVLLRRKTGRVTDTEWMADNPDYAMEIVRFTRARAVEDGHPDLLEWADKLERAVLESVPPKRVLVQTSVSPARDTVAPPASTSPASAPESGFGQSLFGDTGFGESTFGGEPRRPRDPNAPRYVGGIR